VTASRSQCSVCRLDSSHYIEHFACVDFTEFLFPPYPFNRTGLGLIDFGLGLAHKPRLVSISVSVSQSLVSVSVSVSLCYGFVNKPGWLLFLLYSTICLTSITSVLCGWSTVFDFNDSTRHCGTAFIEIAVLLLFVDFKQDFSLENRNSGTPLITVPFLFLLHVLATQSQYGMRY